MTALVFAYDRRVARRFFRGAAARASVEGNSWAAGPTPIRDMLASSKTVARVLGALAEALLETEELGRDWLLSIEDDEAVDGEEGVEAQGNW